jgi:hypothetical protein
VPFVLRATSSDPDEPGGSLACSRLVWRSNTAADPFPVTGCSRDVAFSGAGARTLTLTGTDPQGASDTAQVSVNVRPNRPPAVDITSHSTTNSLRLFEPNTLTGTAADDGGGKQLTFVWSAALNGRDPVKIDETSGLDVSSVTWTPSKTFKFGEGSHDLVVFLKVTDPQGNTGQDSIEGTLVIIG